MNPLEPPIITLTTDFGTKDTYVGEMKGVILGINPLANIVDITHQIQPQSVLEGAFVIGQGYRYFPGGTIHVVVVDPGVGTARGALLLVAPSATFLGPDNGVLSYVLGQEKPHDPDAKDTSREVLPRGYRGYHLTNPKFWRDPVSSTFHGRDIFAPVAAHLSLGIPPQDVGDEVSHIVCLPRSRPQWDGTTLEGRVLHVDRFGNLITDIPSDRLHSGKDIAIEIKGHRIAGLSPSYAEGGGLLAIVGGHGNLELAVRDGSAAREVGAGVGDPVRVTAT